MVSLFLCLIIKTGIISYNSITYAQIEELSISSKMLLNIILIIRQKKQFENAANDA